MKFSLQLASILTALALMIPGCAGEQPEPKHDAPQQIHESAVLPGPIAPPGPVDPSTAVALPPTTNPGTKVEEAKPAETKPEPPK